MLVIHWTAYWAYGKCFQLSVRWFVAYARPDRFAILLIRGNLKLWALCSCGWTVSECIGILRRQIDNTKNQIYIKLEAFRAVFLQQFNAADRPCVVCQGTCVLFQPNSVAGGKRGGGGGGRQTFSCCLSKKFNFGEHEHVRARLMTHLFGQCFSHLDLILDLIS